jgi:HEPN domain-containing protein
MKKATREWVRKAEADHRVAVSLAGAAERSHDQACFLCQQSAEKYLKALMEEQGMTIPRTHDLLVLVAALLPTLPSLKSVNRGLPLLSRYAVAVRYPGFGATKRQTTAAVRWAGRVRSACRSLLGL